MIMLLGFLELCYGENGITRQIEEEENGLTLALTMSMFHLLCMET